jgi:hypothetical protein
MPFAGTTPKPDALIREPFSSGLTEPRVVLTGVEPGGLLGETAHSWIMTESRTASRWGKAVRLETAVASAD